MKLIFSLVLVCSFSRFVMSGTISENINDLLDFLSKDSPPLLDQFLIVDYQYDYDGGDNHILNGGNNMFGGIGGNYISYEYDGVEENDLTYNSSGGIDGVSWQTRATGPFFSAFHVNGTAGSSFTLKVNGQVPHGIVFPLDQEFPDKRPRCRLFLSVSVFFQTSGPSFASIFVVASNNENVTGTLQSTVDPPNFINNNPQNYETTYTVTDNEPYEAYIIQFLVATKSEFTVDTLPEFVANIRSSGVTTSPGVITCSFVNDGEFPVITGPESCVHGKLGFNGDALARECVCDKGYRGVECNIFDVC